MNFTEPQSLFEVSGGFQMENNWRARRVCLKDFLKKCASFPLAVVVKAARTLLRCVGLCLGAGLVVITLGSSSAARALFTSKMGSFAKDLADWFLLPFALFGRFFRLILALFIHPNLYFS